MLNVASDYFVGRTFSARMEPNSYLRVAHSSSRWNSLELLVKTPRGRSHFARISSLLPTRSLPTARTSTHKRETGERLHEEGSVRGCRCTRDDGTAVRFGEGHWPGVGVSSGGHRDRGQNRTPARGPSPDRRAVAALASRGGSAARRHPRAARRRQWLGAPGA